MRRTLHILSIHLLLTAVIILTAACTPGVPSDYLSEGEMEDVLYDYHRAQAMCEAKYGTSEGAQGHEYALAVYRQHGITEAEFDASMKWYSRHSDYLYRVYKKLAERYEKETIGSATNGEVEADALEEGTVNIWNRPNHEVLMADREGFNSMTFSIDCDSTTHAGDSFTLSVRPQFLSLSGMDAVMMLAVELEGDSIVSTSRHFSGNFPATATVETPEGLKIKKIRGFITVSSNGTSAFTSYAGMSDGSIGINQKVVILSNILLLRKSPLAKPKTDAADQSGVSDTISESADIDTAKTTDNEKLRLPPRSAAGRLDTPNGSTNPQR